MEAKEKNNQSLTETLVTIFINWLFPKYTKWILLEVFYFNSNWYSVQVKQNKHNGFKKFKCKKIINGHYGTNTKNLSVECIDDLTNEELTLKD